jgi:hypothetical protein
MAALLSLLAHKVWWIMTTQIHFHTGKRVSIISGKHFLPAGFMACQEGKL